MKDMMDISYKENLVKQLVPTYTSDHDAITKAYGFGTGHCGDVEYSIGLQNGTAIPDII